MAVNVAISGFGRIGRLVLRSIIESKRKDINVVAINDLAPVDTNAFLLANDTVHGPLNEKISVKKNKMTIGRKTISVLNERDPQKLPWKKMKIDVALECTGLFTSKEKASMHIKAGAKKVLVSAPCSEADKTIVYGVNEQEITRLSLHKGIIPFGGTFLIFLDYCKPSLRLAALMKQRAIYILTHDSIGLGEDGPTHQPIEQLASLRATPNVKVFRPADVIETAEAWELALSNQKGPSVIALTRQKLPMLRRKYHAKNISSQGAYEIKSNSKNPDISIYASGSEVEIGIQLMGLLEKKKKNVRVISVPCMELFKIQNKTYQKKIRGNSKLNISIEAGSSFGWSEICGGNTVNICMKDFGASAPYQKLYDYYGFTAKKILKQVIKKI